MLTKEQMQEEFEAFGIIWNAYKYLDEVQKISTDEEAKKTWTEILNQVNYIDDIIKDKDSDIQNFFLKLQLGVIDLLEAKYKGRKKVS